MEKLFKDGVAYTPEMLAASHGLTVAHWDNIIRHHLPELHLPVICVSVSLDCKRKRIAAFGRDLNAWDEEMKRQTIKKQLEREEKQHPQKQQRTQRKPQHIPGLTPDGKIMNRCQLKEAGLWKGA